MLCVKILGMVVAATPRPQSLTKVILPRTATFNPPCAPVPCEALKDTWVQCLHLLFRDSGFILFVSELPRLLG